MKLTTRQIAVAGVLGAITVALGVMPVGGFIEIPGISVTTMHIPTILAGIFEGPVVGGIVGGIFGLFSFWRAFSSVNPLDRIIFTNPLIAFFPRILVGATSHWVFSASRKKSGGLLPALFVAGVVGYTGYAATSFLLSPWRIGVAVLSSVLAAFFAAFLARRFGEGPAVAAIAGSLTNTVSVLGLCALFRYIPKEVAAAVAIANGLPEAFAAMVLVSLIYRSTGRFNRKKS